MCAGTLLEAGECDAVYTELLHPYTQALLSAALPLHPLAKRQRISLPGEVPNPLHPPSGYRFHPRCPQALPQCQTHEPAWREIMPGHYPACHLYEGAFHNPYPGALPFRTRGCLPSSHSDRRRALLLRHQYRSAECFNGWTTAPDVCRSARAAQDRASVPLNVGHRSWEDSPASLPSLWGRPRAPTAAGHMARGTPGVPSI